MIFFILILLAAFFKSIADTLKWHFEVSVFSGKKQTFWNPAVSYLNAPRIPLTKYPLDAWHIANSLMIICFILAAVANRHWWPMQWPWWLQIITAGLSFNILFEWLFSTVWRGKNRKVNKAFYVDIDDLK